MSVPSTRRSIHRAGVTQRGRDGRSQGCRCPWVVGVGRQCGWDGNKVDELRERNKIDSQRGSSARVCKPADYVTTSVLRREKGEKYRSSNGACDGVEWCVCVLRMWSNWGSHGNRWCVWVCGGCGLGEGRGGSCGGAVYWVRVVRVQWKGGCQGRRRRRLSRGDGGSGNGGSGGRREGRGGVGVSARGSGLWALWRFALLWVLVVWER